MNHLPLRLQLSAVLEALREKDMLADYQIAARWDIAPGTLTHLQDTERNWRKGTAEKVERIVTEEIAKGTLLERNAAPTKCDKCGAALPGHFTRCPEYA